jgi:hypothetical protein
MDWLKAVMAVVISRTGQFDASVHLSTGLHPNWRQRSPHPWVRTGSDNPLRGR